MITTGELWEFADQVHAKDEALIVVPTGFTRDRFDSSKSFFGRGKGRDGFQAALYKDSSALGAKVVAIAGTQGMALNDLTADMKIALHVMPNQASAAMKFYQSVVRGDDENVIITGHSLGGAQVLGYWCNRPFVTFNAPRMASVIGASQWNFLNPNVLRRSRNAKKAREGDGMVRGINFRISRDLIGKFGKHVGEVVVLKSHPSFISGHSNLDRVLRDEMVNGQQSLYDVDPFMLTDAHFAMLS